MQPQNFQQSRVRGPAVAGILISTICGHIYNIHNIYIYNWQYSSAAVGQSRVRGGVLPHQDVHHPHVIRQGRYLTIYISTYLPIYISTYLPIYISTMCVSGLGCGVPAPDRDQHPLLDRASPQRAPAVAGPGPHTGATIKYFLAPENIFFLFI